MDKGRNIWSDMKARKYGSGGGGSIQRGKFSTNVNENCEGKRGGSVS